MSITHGTAARKKLLKGALELARVVGVTYGPCGRNCILDRMAGLLVTKDGVTVAREVTLADPVENMGAQILKTACLKVNDEVGDGTTTTSILAAELVREGHKMILSGTDPTQMIRGMRVAANFADARIRQMASSIKTVKQIERVALLASNGDTEVATALAEATMAVGKDGTIVIEDGQSTDVRLEFKEGMEIDRGPVNTMSLGDKPERKMDGPLVAVIGEHLTSMADIQELLEVASQWKPRELLVFALSVSQEALKVMLLNDAKEVMRSVAIRCPGFGQHQEDYLKDVAALSGATYVTRGTGLDHRAWEAEWFGAVREVTIKEKLTTLMAYEVGHEDLQVYIQGLREMESHCNSEFDRDKLRERMARLSGGLVILRVGGVTEAAMKERRARIEDALGAVRAAFHGGVVPGGGSAFVQAAMGLQAPPDETVDFRTGWAVLEKALFQPLRVLAQNAGTDGEAVVQRVTAELWSRPEASRGHGWDARTGEIRDLLMEPEVVDPRDVCLSALRAAVSVATTLLSCETAIVEVPK